MKTKLFFSLYKYIVIIFILFICQTASAFSFNFGSKKKEAVPEAASKTPGTPVDNKQEELIVKKEEAAPLKEISQENKKIILSIPRAPEDKKFSIGSIPASFAEGAVKPQQEKFDYTKDIGLVKQMGEVKSSHPGVYALKDCVDIAVKNHLPLQIAKKSVKLAEMRLFEARRNLLPSASVDYQEYHGRVNGLMYVGRKQVIEGKQPIFHGGELFYTMKQAEVNLAVTKSDYDRVRNELVLQVKKAYYALVKSKSNLKMQQDLYAEISKTVEMVNKEAEAGLVSRIETMNVASQAGQAKYQIASAEGDFDVAELMLKQAMNIDPKEKVDVKEGLEFKKVTVDYEKALSIAMVNRPEMKVNSMMISYYNYGKGIAKAKLWPQVDLLGSWGLAKEEYATEDQVGARSQLNGDPDRKLEQQWYAGLKVGMPFWGSSGEYSYTKEQWVPVVSAYQGTEATTMDFKFKLLDRLDTLSEPHLADIDLDKAKQELIKIRNSVTLEVKEGCFGYEKALIQAATAENKIKYQTSELELIKLKRGLDEAQDSNVIESMIRLAQEKFGLLQALADCHVSLASLNKAIGIEDYYKDE